MSLVRGSSSTNPLKVGVLVSGSGSNLQALIDRSQVKDAAFEVRAVVSNKRDVFALTRAAEAGVHNVVIEHGSFSSRGAFEAQLLAELHEQEIELVVLAGFMRVLSETFLAAFPFLVVNVHPALCPAFPGLHAPQQALAAGVRVTGCTVHLVDHGVDTGPILEQSVVHIEEHDEEESLTRKIQKQEHLLYPRVVQDIALGLYRLDGDKRIHRALYEA